MTILLLAQIIFSILLVVLIFPQSQGGGLGSAFGGGSYHTRRGIEKGIFTLTIITAVIYTGISLAQLF